jgi:hypothetical protein
MPGFVYKWLQNKHPLGNNHNLQVVLNVGYVYTG